MIADDTDQIIAAVRAASIAETARSGTRPAYRQGGPGASYRSGGAYRSSGAGTDYHPASHHRSRRKSRRRGGRLTGVLLGIILLLLAAIAVVAFPRVASELSVEVGSPRPKADAFLKGGAFDVELVRGLDESVDMGAIGDYPVVLRVLGRERNAVLHVVDTTPPVVETKPVQVSVSGEVQPEDVIASVRDRTPVTAFFPAPPDLSRPGRQTVRVSVKDAGGNLTEADAVIEVLEDTQPPVIEGVRELTVQVGGSVSYKKGVTVSDDSGAEPELVVDNSAVDLKTAGSYPVKYSATDAAGNTAEVSTTLFVITPMAPEITEEKVREKAREVLGQIVKADMSQYEAAKAIYWWCHERIAYVDSSDKDNWVKAAYQGLVRRSGDCYVYAMTSKVLLTEAGITNMLIEKIPTKTMHYWNLIDIGEGWRHFDTTRRVGGATFFYQTDAELMAYSDAHNGTHAYDRSKYPEIP